MSGIGETCERLAAMVTPALWWSGVEMYLWSSKGLDSWNVGSGRSEGQRSWPENQRNQRSTLFVLDSQCRVLLVSEKKRW